MSSDHVHPTEEGHRRLGEVAYKTFKNSKAFNSRVEKIRRGIDEDYNNGVEQTLAAFKAE